MSLSRVHSPRAPLSSYVLFTATILLVATLIVGTSSASDTAPTSITLLYNASVRGEIDDCGCKSKPLGGVARRAALIDEIRASSSPCLVIDGGNLYGKPGSEGRAQTEFLCEQTEAMGYDVFGVGVSDFAYGLEFLSAMESRHGFAYTCANLVDAESGEPLFATYRIVERGGILLGILSVLDPAFELKDETGPIDGLRVESPLMAVQRELPGLNERVDVVVLVSNLKSNATRILLNDLGDDSGVDVAIEGTVGRRYPRAQKVGQTVLLAANSRGKYLGQCELLVRDGELIDVDVNVHELKLDLTEDEQMASRVDEFKKQQEVLAQADR